MKASFDEKAIDGIFKSVDQCHLPGVAIGISIGGTPVYRKGFGLANMELPITLTPATRMRLHSITKHFTCLAYLLLCEDGKADINDPVGKYLPELHPVTHRVTMRHLMSNTSGLRDASEIRWFFSGIERTVRAPELLELYRDIRDVNFAPGVAWCYNNGAFRILSAVIEKVEERSLEEVFRKRIFEPVGMNDTLLRRADTDFLWNSASMHSSVPGGGYEKRYLPGEIVGEGGIVSTVDDMLRWLRHMANPVVGRADTWALMTASQKLLNGAETGYGLGLTARPYRDLSVISHGGGGLGGNSQMVRVPCAGLDVIAIANRKDVRTAELVGQILDACLGLKTHPTRGVTPCVTGLFRSRNSGRVIQLYGENERQIAIIDGVEKWELFRSDDDALRTAQSWFWDLALKVRGDHVHPDGISYESFGCKDELLAAPETGDTMLDTAARHYQSDETGVRITISGDSEGGRLITAGRFGSTSYRLEPIGERLWRATHDSIWGATLALAPDGQNLTLRTSRTWQVRFRRAA